MSKIFFTADTHFNHSNIIKYENRPFNNVHEMNEELIKRWNNKVGKNDRVYVLGDFAFDRDGTYVVELVRRLNGTIYLIKGNHDSYTKHREAREVFGFVKDYYQLKYNNKAFILFHYPIAQWDKAHHGSYHLYGHIHSNNQDHHPMNFDLGRAMNVGVDVNNFEPVFIEDVINYLD